MPVVQSTWVEGALEFRFPAGAMASKYDDWAFYREQFQDACGGNKAVDFVYYEQGVGWIIEVKDYRIHARTKAVDLAEEVAAKVRDTLAGLMAASVNANDADERQLARSMTHARKLRVVFHFEQPQVPSRLRPQPVDPDKLLLKLRQMLKAIDPHPLITSRVAVRRDLDWQVV